VVSWFVGRSCRGECCVREWQKSARLFFRGTLQGRFPFRV
jgi:hypothetical protein